MTTDKDHTIQVPTPSLGIGAGMLFIMLAKDINANDFKCSIHRILITRYHLRAKDKVLDMSEVSNL